MARKSRKTYRENLYGTDCAVQKIPEKTKSAVAAYCRLSKADEITGRESMASQTEIIRQFVDAREDMELADVFVDDGYSGTNYERPQFEKMMEGIRAGKYQCMIVKDLSRLGRSYLETSDLLEMELPLFGCRFISVNAHIDTATEQIDTILVGLKNIMNQKYAEDISKKIKTSFRQRAKNGEMLGGRVPYGYKRNPENVGYLLIDEESADVIRHIFDLKIKGLNDAKIARQLDAEGVLTPIQYHQFKKSGKMPEIRKKWRTDSVRDITINPTVLGHMVHGKFKEKLYLGQKNSRTRRADWVVYENVNPPIVSQEIFDQAQEARKKIYNRKEWQGV